MAQIQCKTCGNVVPDDTQVCPKCGQNPYVNPAPYVNPQFQQPMMQQPRSNNNMLLIIIIILLVLLIGCVVGYFLMKDGSAPREAEKSSAVHDTVVVVAERAAAPAHAAPAPPPAPRTSGAKDARNASGNDYSWICYTRLSPADLAGLSRSELRVMRNTIYARHGYKFNSADLRNYFSQFDWYYPVTSVVPDNELSATEKHNINLIKSFE